MFVRVAADRDVPERTLRRFQAERRLVTIARAGGSLYSFDDACPHQGCPLAEDGHLDGDVLTCGCHGSQYDVTTGQVLRGPATDALTMYVARAEGEAILVEV